MTAISLHTGDKVVDASGREWIITITDDEQLTVALGVDEEHGKTVVVEAADLPCPVQVTRVYSTIEGM